MTTIGKFAPTEEQASIVAEMRSARRSLMIEAGAGCAKTTTLVLAAKEVRQQALCLSFNKSIAREMERKLGAAFTTKTMNGLGHGAWSRVVQASSLTLDDRKVGKLCSQVAKDARVELASDQWDGLRRLVSAAMMAGLVPARDDFEHQSLVPDDRDGWDGVADEVDVADFDLIWPLARQVLKQNIQLARAGIVSFDDQIYCSTMLGGRFPSFGLVMVDEYQDLSQLNIKMLGKCTRDDGRIAAAGDKRQAIYGWRGASGDAGAEISALRPTWTSLPLMTTFRCPKTVVARQQWHVPGFRAAEQAPEGKVEVVPDSNSGEFWEQFAKAVPSGAAILCRNNAPLLRMAFWLIRGGIGCHMLGRDIGKELVMLSRKIVPDDNTPADICAGKVEEWRESEASKLASAGKGEKVAGVHDKAECLQAVLELGISDAGMLRRTLEQLFAREAGLVTLSSIHRAKGLEWDFVIHLDPWRVPSKYAKRAAEAGRPQALQQEWNLQYVCETRTKDTLVLVGAPGRQGEQE